MKHIISLGAGVQSTTMALMAAHGEITPMPDCAIFADTGSEPLGVYSQVLRLKADLPFPVYTVSAGNLRDEVTGQRPDKRNGWGRPPFFVVRDDGRASQLNRQCTSEYKIDPIRRKVRELAGLKPRSRPKEVVVEQWIGISLDEVMRCKPSRDAWQVNRWPLIEKRMNRRDCLKWLGVNGYPEPPKSACTFCPYRDDFGWRKMRDEDPASFQEACDVDKAVRTGMPGVSKSQVFLHRSLKPLDEVDLSTAEDRGQLNLFLNECEGMCGV